MGLLKTIKKGIQERRKEKRVIRKERKEFLKTLRPKLRKVRREQITTEALKQEKISATAEVKRKYAPKKSFFVTIGESVGKVGREIERRQKPRRVKRVKRVKKRKGKIIIIDGKKYRTVTTKKKVRRVRKVKRKY